ncbi:hypothetical protein [Peribacillus asahii]|uniref:hypothetical protein n=1 Tax=Peribacillus asahii TaxID=228899 RepID=UPI0038009E62
MKSNVNLPEPIVGLVKEVFKNEDVKVADWDMDRIYIDKGNEEYTIRTWDITKTNVRWTLFKNINNPDGTGHGEEVSEGNFKYA